jgi:transcriptional regulator with XRE-family HTH domain
MLSWCFPYLFLLANGGRHLFLFILFQTILNFEGFCSQLFAPFVRYDDFVTPKPFNLNNLRQMRDSSHLTREQILKRAADLAKGNPDNHVPLSLSALKKLESGLSRPRPRTAVTLASALSTTVEALFPHGLDDTPRNPQGLTHIPVDRRKGGRPKKKTEPG